jgi:hypothetical protein
MENNPVVRVVVTGPDEIRCWIKTRIFGYWHTFDALSEAAQLAEPPPANTVRPRTVASTTGSPASAARRRNFRRSSSLTSSIDEDDAERSRSGRVLSAIRVPTTRSRPERSGR